MLGCSYTAKTNNSTKQLPTNTTAQTTPVNKTQNTSQLTMAINSPLRSDKNKNRDQYRHPEQTLAFFDIQPDMTVVEVSPGGGWYTEILAPYLQTSGQFYAAHFPENAKSKYYQKNLKKFKLKMQSNPAYQNVNITEFAADRDYDIAPTGTADRVLTFRNLHNWYMQKNTQGLQQAFKTFYRALKPGGILGIVDHQLPEDRDQETWIKSGYLKQSIAIEFATQAGFQLVGISDINSNPKDTADHENGVWSLPPSQRGGNKELLKIGESNRFTLKFIKPIN
ncbi:class I SAM-dependent methyltransferase [Algibacillus agarilyticus]|uniref:class I SAM-dependent methyltransferase n=1 Tax=Algibacillus agarilyticus TaxID=2234133 RepID=UPI003F696F16